jgi:hypothetical protein
MEWKYIRKSHDCKVSERQAHHPLWGIYNEPRVVPRKLQHESKSPLSKQTRCNLYNAPLDLAPLSNPISSVRHRLFDVLLSHHGPDSSLFRSASWLRDGVRLSGLGNRRPRPCTSAPIPP